MRQNEHVTICGVSPSGGASPFSGKAVKKHDMTFLAISPLGLISAIARHIVRQTELIPLGRMSAARRAFGLIRKAIVEHRETLAAIAPVCLGFFCLDELVPMWKFEFVSIRVMGAATRARSFGGEPVEEKDSTLIAVAPLTLEEVVVDRSRSDQ